MALVSTPRHLERRKNEYLARTGKKIYLLQPSATAASEDDSDVALLARIVPGTSLNYNPGGGAYDAAQGRWELAPVTVTIAAGSTAIQYQGSLVVSGSPESVDFVEWYTTSNTVPANTSQQLTIALNFGKGTADVNAP